MRAAGERAELARRGRPCRQGAQGTQHTEVWRCIEGCSLGEREESRLCGQGGTSRSPSDVTWVLLSASLSTLLEASTPCGRARGQCVPGLARCSGSARLQGFLGGCKMCSAPLAHLPSAELQPWMQGPWDLGCRGGGYWPARNLTGKRSHFCLAGDFY